MYVFSDETLDQALVVSLVQSFLSLMKSLILLVVMAFKALGEALHCSLGWFLAARLFLLVRI